MAKKRREGSSMSDDAAERIAHEVAALVYAAYGFAPAALVNLPRDSPVRSVSRKEARSTVLQMRLLSEKELTSLSLEAATELALQRLSDGA